MPMVLRDRGKGKKTNVKEGIKGTATARIRSRETPLTSAVARGIA